MKSKDEIINKFGMNGYLCFELRKEIPKEQFASVFSSACDIDYEFLGFVEIYKNLSSMIPNHWTVIDLGCAYAPQSFYFKNHKRYIGIDVYNGPRFYANNTEHYITSIQEFIINRINEFDLSETFAICSYVPLMGKTYDMVRKYFWNLFIYYPHGETNPCEDFLSGSAPGQGQK